MKLWQFSATHSERHKKMIRPFNNKSILGSHTIVALFFFTLIVIGLTWSTYLHTDVQLREDLLQQAWIVAKSIQPERLGTLSGIPSDETNPNYLKLKTQLAHLRHANSRCRFLYLLGRDKNGVIFFYVDSEPAGSTDESPPGQTYDEAPESFQNVFTTGQAVVVGPVRDRWGTWVTALVPLTQPETGEVIAVVGMDIDATTWKWDVLSLVALHLGLLMILVLVVGSMWLAVRKFESGVSRHGLH